MCRLSESARALAHPLLRSSLMPIDPHGDDVLEPRTPTERGFTIARIAGVEIAIDVSWLFVFALVLWSLAAGYFPVRYPGHGWGAYLGVGLLACLLFFASVLIHELAHAVVANGLGEEVRRITLFIFGGMAHLGAEPKSPAAELKIAAVGPLTSFALAAVFWAVGRIFVPDGVAYGLWTGIFPYLTFINVALGVFNLLPGFPLDGGRLLRAWLWRRSGDLQAATARAGQWGAHMATVLMVLGGLQIFAGALVGGLWLIFIAMFLRGAAWAGVQAVTIERVLGRTPVARIMVEDPVVVSPDASLAEAVDDYFMRYGYGGFPVARDGDVEGMLSLSDVKQCPPDERGRRAVREVMRPLTEAMRVAPSTSMSEALRRMVDAGAGRLLVTERGRLRALVTRDGITRFLRMHAALEEPQAEGAA
jgi:Zn-dependent protease/CBS domain-containing protein